jgi:hypothetical protein
LFVAEMLRNYFSNFEPYMCKILKANLAHNLNLWSAKKPYTAVAKATPKVVSFTHTVLFPYDTSWLHLIFTLTEDELSDNYFSLYFFADVCYRGLFSLKYDIGSRASMGRNIQICKG